MKISLLLAAVLLTASLVSGCASPRPGASGIDGGPTAPRFLPRDPGPAGSQLNVHKY